MRHVPVWHFWNPRSGAIGGFIFALVLWAAIIAAVLVVVN